MNLAQQQQLQLSALNSSHERAQRLAEVSYPSRKTVEMNQLTKSAKDVSKLLEIYDVLEEPPAFADLARNLFGEAIVRLDDLCASAAAAKAAKTSNP